MEGLEGCVIIGLVAWWFYKSGKRTGSRKGYNVGRRRSNRNHHRRR